MAKKQSPVPYGKVSLGVEEARNFLKTVRRFELVPPDSVVQILKYGPAPRIRAVGDEIDAFIFTPLWIRSVFRNKTLQWLHDHGCADPITLRYLETINNPDLVLHGGAYHHSLLPGMKFYRDFAHVAFVDKWRFIFYNDGIVAEENTGRRATSIHGATYKYASGFSGKSFRLYCINNGDYCDVADCIPDEIFDGLLKMTKATKGEASEPIMGHRYKAVPRYGLIVIKQATTEVGVDDVKAAEAAKE